MSSRFKPITVAFIAAFALAMFGAQYSFAGDDDASGGPDADWEAVGQVLELPRACDSAGAGAPCDRADSSGDDDDEDDNDGIATAHRGTPPEPVPPTLDDDTASNQPPPSDWGSVDDYETESTYYPVPLGVYAASRPSYGGLKSLPPSAYPISPMASSNPLTPAATPPLGSGGPWMSAPAPWGSPGGMMMPGRSFPSH